MIGRRVAAAMFGASLVAGCATGPADELPWTSGRLSITVDAVPGRDAQRLAAEFELRGDGRRGELRLSGPLGARLALARWSPSEAVLDTGQGERRYEDLDALSREAFGEALPLRALPDWLAGRPWPGAASMARRDGFEQLDWLVNLAEYGAGRVDAVRERAPRVSVRIRLATGAG